jgi:hypothetical protein
MSEEKKKDMCEGCPHRRDCESIENMEGDKCYEFMGTLDSDVLRQIQECCGPWSSAHVFNDYGMCIYCDTVNDYSRFENSKSLPVMGGFNREGG